MVSIPPETDRGLPHPGSWETRCALDFEEVEPGPVGAALVGVVVVELVVKMAVAQEFQKFEQRTLVLVARSHYN